MVKKFVTEMIAPKLTDNQIWTRYVCPVIDEIPTCVSQHASCASYKAGMFSETRVELMKQKCTAYATKCTDEWISVQITKCTSSAIVSAWELSMMASCSGEAAAGTLNSSANKESCCMAAKGLTTCLSECILGITATSHSGYNENCADSRQTDIAFLENCPDSGIPSQKEVNAHIANNNLPECTAWTVDESRANLQSRI